MSSAVPTGLPKPVTPGSDFVPFAKNEFTFHPDGRKEFALLVMSMMLPS